ncbi:beta-1,4-N-acetylgalactosaminyltransferase bre-4-like [Gigantopelta aegis]|uniref:beta-1,4-N-acetylgalactosaminyltransferase bre-4-like n=1 Tax=Gigantopelta aegis TaxID=1735272 RepID=UPI001B88DCD7|nr:beta-1,4-N-acetylgalactosaminyltransferase bre-4-like [Gigantopelta aegis]
MGKHVRTTVLLLYVMALVIAVDFLKTIVYDMSLWTLEPSAIDISTRSRQRGETAKNNTNYNSRTRKEIVNTDIGFLSTIGKAPPCKSFDSNRSTWPSCDALFSVRNKNGPPQTMMVSVSFERLGNAHGVGLLPGGLFRPVGCTPSQRVAIIVPFRDRVVHLKTLLNCLHPMLKSQTIEYMIFVVEQSPVSVFNRGMVKNIGFVEARRLCDFDCYIFHDVDLLPLDYRNTYTCSEMPRHHAASIDRFNYTLPYRNIFGGVVSFRRDMFEKVNGYSNMYVGWGGEDDDLATRVQLNGMNIERYPMEISRYKNLRHAKDKPNKERMQLLESSYKRMKTDGINSLIYTRHLMEFRQLYTWIYVSIDDKYYKHVLM